MNNALSSTTVCVCRYPWIYPRATSPQVKKRRENEDHNNATSSTLMNVWVRWETGRHCLRCFKRGVCGGRGGRGDISSGSQENIHKKKKMFATKYKHTIHSTTNMVLLAESFSPAGQLMFTDRFTQPVHVCDAIWASLLPTFFFQNPLKRDFWSANRSCVANIRAHTPIRTGNPAFWYSPEVWVNKDHGSVYCTFQESSKCSLNFLKHCNAMVNWRGYNLAMVSQRYISPSLHVLCTMLTPVARSVAATKCFRQV